MAFTSRANWVKGTNSGVAVRDLIKREEFVGLSRDGRAVDAQWPSFSAQGTGIRALEVLKHAVGIGNEVGRHLYRRQVVRLEPECYALEGISENE